MRPTPLKIQSYESNFMTPSMQPDPGLIFAELRAYERSAALKGAIDLELFTLIDDGATTPAEMAAKTQGSERGYRILCDFLTMAGHLTKFGDSYGLTTNSQLFLSKRSPAYLGSISDFLAGEHQRNALWQVEAAGRKGGSESDQALAPDHPMWVACVRGMAPMMRAFAGGGIPHVVAGDAPMKILDISASHGIYGITALQLNPSAQATGQDWASVLEVAKENAAKAGVADRYHTLPGSAFDVDFGSGWDLILEPNFAHHFDRAGNMEIFK